MTGSLRSTERLQQSRPAFEQWLACFHTAPQSQATGAKSLLVAVGKQPLLEAVPADDPQQVREISAAILDRYRVDRGHDELSGCTLDPRPFLRLTVAAADECVRHVWFGADGRPIETELRDRLHLQQLVPCEPRLRSADADTVQQWIAAARGDETAMPQRDTGARNADFSDALLAATVVWCRWAEGTVAFRFDAGFSAQITFSGWAADFLHRRTTPPPFVCAESQLAGYHLHALADGTVTVHEAIAQCEVSGAETLACRLVTCPHSGRRVLPDHLITCPITQQALLPDAMQRCSWCDRQVAATEIDAGRCSGCRKGTPIAPGDRLLDFLFHHDPRLRRYTHWHGWQDETRAVAIGQRWWKQVAVVCDLQPLAVRKRFETGGWKRGWQRFDAAAGSPLEDAACGKPK